MAFYVIPRLLKMCSELNYNVSAALTLSRSWCTFLKHYSALIKMMASFVVHYLLSNSSFKIRKFKSSIWFDILQNLSFSVIKLRTYNQSVQDIKIHIKGNSGLEKFKIQNFALEEGSSSFFETAIESLKTVIFYAFITF